MGANNLGTQIKGLHKLVPVTKGKLCKLIEKNANVFISGLFVFSSHIQPIREYLSTVCKKTVKSRLDTCGFNS